MFAWFWLFLMILPNLSFAWNPSYEQRYSRIPPSTAFQFVFAQLGPIFDLCLESEDCLLNPSEKLLLSSIRSSLDLEKKKNPQLIQFDSSVLNPGRFWQDGQVRIAVTGSEIGSTIFVNLALAQELPYHRALSILTHELGHHHQIRSHEALFQLGLKVESFFLKQMQWTAISGENQENQDLETRPLRIHLGVAQFPFVSDSQPQISKNMIWIYDEKRMVDIGPELTQKLKCPYQEKNAKLVSYRLYVPRWHSYFHHPTKANMKIYVMSATLQMTCSYLENQKEISKSFPSRELLMYFSFRFSKDKEFPSSGPVLDKGKYYVFDQFEKIDLLE